MSHAPAANHSATDRQADDGAVALGALRLMLMGCAAAVMFTLGRAAWLVAGL